MTNAQLDTAIAAAADTARMAGLDTTPELDDLFAQRNERIVASIKAYRKADAKFAADMDKAANKLTKANMRIWLKKAGVDPATAIWTDLNDAIVEILEARGPSNATQEQLEAIWARAEDWTDKF